MKSGARQNMKQRRKIKMSAGDKVRLKMDVDVGNIPPNRENHPDAVIDVKLSDIDGGVIVNRDLGGMRYWNEDDLELVEK